jgi:endogenous inhibitor of DNA gyrase (YacG/DUF329 family)
VKPSEEHDFICPTCGYDVPTMECPDCLRQVPVTPHGLFRVHPTTGPNCLRSSTLAPVPDDLDPRVTATELVTFQLDGETHQLRLSSANAHRLRDAYRPYVAAGRGLDRRRSRHALVVA